MDYNHFIFGIIVIIIPFLLLVLCYRNYVYHYCQNDIQCLKNKLIYNLHKNKNQEQIEGFFGGIGDWLSGNSSNLPVSSGTINNENLNILEQKINSKSAISKKFPPDDLDDNEFKDADNTDLLKSIGSKPLMKLPDKGDEDQPLPNQDNNKEPEAIFNKLPKIEAKNIPSPKVDIKSVLGSCQFFNDRCPDNYHPLGNFSIEGISGSSILTCGNVQNTKPAKAIAEIRKNSIYEIHITDQGHGFNPEKPPKISIEGGKGHGATAEGIVDDTGFLKQIKVIHPGYNYTETPNVLIDAPFMNSSCHLCCKGDL